jgi:hypothetical protein
LTCKRTAILLGKVPEWLVEPGGLALYGLAGLLVHRTPLFGLLDSIPPLVFAVLFPYIDGFGRTMGATTFAFDVVLSHPLPSVRNSPFAMLLIATITGAGGGLLVPAMGAFTTRWSYNTPPWLVGLPTVDIWGPPASAAIYGALIDAHPVFKPLRTALLVLAGGLIKDREGPLLLPDEAKVVASIAHVAFLFGAIAYPAWKVAVAKSRVTPPNGRPVGERNAARRAAEERSKKSE